MYVSISRGTGGGDVDGGKSITWLSSATAAAVSVADLLRDPSGDSTADSPANEFLDGE